MAVFVYSSYWRTWSRVLLEGKDQTGISVEVDLTEPNGTWSRVKTQNIRSHLTPRGNSDILTDVLPEEIRIRLLMNLGEAFVTRLLTYDYLPYIDWNKYKEHCNGGAAFDLIRRTF